MIASAYIYRSFRALAHRVGPVRLEAACARAVRQGPKQPLPRRM